MAKTIFKLFILYSYIIFGMGGGEVEKNYQEIRRGCCTNSAFANGVSVGGARHNNFPFETHFSAPLLTIIAQSLNDLQFLALERIHFAFWFLFYNERTDTIIFAN